MFSFTHRIVLTLLFTACVGGPGSVAIAQDLPAAPKRQYTQKEYYADLLQMHRRDLVEGYRAHGRHDAKWDAAVTELLEGMSRHFTALGAPERLKPTYPGADELIRQAKVLLDGGCDEPLVSYSLIALEAYKGNVTTEFDAILKNAREMDTSDYDVVRKYMAWLRTGKAMPARRPELFAEYQRRERTLRMQAIFGKAPDAITRRYRLVTFRLDKHKEPVMADLLKGMADVQDRDEWMVHMVRGYDAIQAALETRGSQWMGRQAESDWEGFHQHMAAAEKELTEAYRLDPRCPESATAMIVVSRSQEGDKRLLTPRQWFDRATSAQFDYEPAYREYRYVVHPRFIEDPVPLLQFGIECVNTLRFDTNVPEMYFDILNELRGEMTQADAVYRMEGVYDSLVLLFDGLCKEPSRKAEVDRLRSREAGLAWKCGHAGDAKKLLDALGDRMDNMGLNEAGTSMAQAVPAINAAVSPQATNIAVADQLLVTGHAEQAGEFYQSALAKLGDSADDKQTRAYVDRRLRLVEMAKIYERTGELDLTPAKDLTAWTVMRGDWKVDGDGLLGESDDAGLLLALEFPAGKRWELTGQLGMLVDKPFMRADNTTLYYGYFGHHSMVGGWPLLSSITEAMLQKGMTPAMPFMDAMPFKMLRWDDCVAVQFAQDRIHAYRAHGAMGDTSLPLAFGGDYPRKPGRTMRFWKLHLKRLPDEAPDWVKDAK